MAWDDTPPDTATQAWDAAPPAKDELGPKWSDLPGNIIPDAEKVAKGALDLGLRTGKGIMDLPSDVVSTGQGELENLLAGKSPLEGITNSPIGQDVKTVGGTALNTIKAIPGQLKDLVSKEAWVNRPVENAMNVAALAGMGKELLPEGAVPPEVPNVPRGTVPEVPEVPPEAPKGLPVVEPGAKTGEPHALFAYNDNFGEGGAPRSIYNVFGDPEHPAIKAVGYGSSVTPDVLEKNGIPITGREPRSVGKGEPLEMPKAAPESEEAPPKAEAPPAAKDPLQDVKDYINSKYQAAAGKPGVAQKLAKILDEESANLGAKDLGLMGRQIQTMGQGFEGLEKAKALVNYAREKGYFDPTLTDVGRRDLITKNMKQAGAQVDAIRNLADQRGAPPIQAIKDAVKQQLEAAYGAGVEKAPAEIKNVMDEVDKAKPTFSGMSDLATKLNKSATKVKDLGQHPGPTTDAANIVSRINNDAIRSTLNKQEADLYTQSLRDYGAHKKLEQATAASGRRGMAARTNQRGILGRLYQEALDRGGYRIGGNIANRTAQAIMKNPQIQTLPQFFEELAHQGNEALDETINGMYEGGRVPHDVRKYVGC